MDDKIRLFRPDLNMKRMNLAAHRSGLPIFDGEELINCMKRLIQIDQEWVPHSEASTLYIRPTLIGTEVSSVTKIPKDCLLLLNHPGKTMHTIYRFIVTRSRIYHIQSEAYQ